MRFEGLAVEISIQACALIAYGLMATNFTCIILYSAEALPTQFRATGSGILHASCRPGSIIGMQLLKLGSYNLCKNILEQIWEVKEEELIIDEVKIDLHPAWGRSNIGPRAFKLLSSET